MPQNEAAVDCNYLIEKYENVFSLRNNDFFELLGMDFYLQEFLFFPQEAYFFAKINASDEEKAKEIGIVSSLVYLSTKIHFLLNNEDKENFAAKVQFPILLGDLLYGKVIEILSSGSCSAYISDYLIYLQRLNAGTVDYFAKKNAIEDVWQGRYAELAVLTARLVGANDLSSAYKLGEKFGTGSFYDDLFASGKEIVGEHAELFAKAFRLNGDPCSIITSIADLLQKIKREIS